MERCLEIFERIKAEGRLALEAFIADRQAEELFLDFKRASNNGADVKLPNLDRKNLSKAISGFGNSEGGVIVWGVDCSQGIDGADVAKALVPIENPKRFVSLLQGAVSGCTIPPHSKVEHHAIEDENGKGYVVTLIPKSDATPHQSVVNKQYYIRAGSDFVPTPHDVLGGMFGRRPQPHVFPNFILSVPKLENTKLKIDFGLAVHNEGPGIASDVFYICRVDSTPGPNCHISIGTPDQINWTGSSEFGRQLSLISTSGYRMPPGASAQPMILSLVLAPPFDSALKVFIRVGAGESRRYESIIGSSLETVQQQYESFVQKNGVGEFPNKEKQEIAGAILKQDET